MEGLKQKIIASPPSMIGGIEEKLLSWPVLAAIPFLWIFLNGIYRLYFHPLAKFPGPKLAALTLWYETYYDVWQRGKYVYKIEEMHKKYGINPRQQFCRIFFIDI